jgi:hypothetical protein
MARRQTSKVELVGVEQQLLAHGSAGPLADIQ